MSSLPNAVSQSVVPANELHHSIDVDLLGDLIYYKFSRCEDFDAPTRGNVIRYEPQKIEIEEITRHSAHRAQLAILVLLSPSSASN
jgi:hypothetical protein